MLETFVAYASGNAFHNKMICSAAKAASTDDRKLVPWSACDTSGFPIAGSVDSWIQRADSFVADVSEPNDNVTYEIGYAIGLGKPVRLIRSEHVDFSPVKRIALLNTLGHDAYTLEHTLVRVLKKRDATPKWPDVQKNRDQPVFILTPPKSTDLSLKVTSAIKKTARLRFRSFKPWEVSRLNASEAYEMATASYGVILFWVDGTDEDAVRNNQRASFMFGVARGRGIPVVLLAHERQELSLDLQDHATRWHEYADSRPHQSGGGFAV